MFDFLKTKFEKFYKSDADGFSVYFPTDAECEEHARFNTNIYKSGWPGEGYVVTVDYSGARNNEEQIKALERYADFSKIAHKPITARTDTFLNFPCLYSVYFSTETNPHMHIVERKFYTDKREYTLTASNKKKDKAIEKFEEYIKGFKLI